MKKRGKHIKENQLRKNLFLQIVTVLFLMLVAFIIYSNLKYILIDQKKQAQKEKWQQNIVQVVENAKKERIPEQECGEQSEVYLWGSQSNGRQLTKSQLNNMKISYAEKDELLDCAQASLLFVTKSTFLEDEIALLNEWVQNGMIVFFTEIPEEAELRKSSVRNLLGIDSYKGMIKDGGIRLSEALLFDEIAESSGDTEVNNITLTRQTEVFAQSLEKKIPMFWRYKQSVNTGCVYVADALLLEQKTGYAVVSFLFENINESFMYPIVNAYCFMVLGMPYTGDAENISKEYLESVYGKNALGVQNDIFFPEICRCEDKYSLEVSWYSAQKEAVEESSDPLIRYYVRSQKEQIGEWNPNTKEAKAFAAVDNCLEEWTPQFCWMDEEQVRIPYTDITTEEYRAVLVQNLATVKGLGFIASSINISSFLSEESGADWIDFCNNLESVLGTEKQEITWLDRVSAQEAVYRISAYEVMEPHISYASDGIEIQIDCFTGRAYFYLHTGKEIKGVLHAEAAEIAEDLYMVTVTEETARIEFYQ